MWHRKVTKNYCKLESQISGSMLKILLIWLRFCREFMVSLIFLEINLLSLSTNFFWFQLMFWSASQQCFAFSFFLQSQFLTDLLGSSERDFKDRLDSPCRLLRSYYSQFRIQYFFIFCSHSIFRFTKEFMQIAFNVESVYNSVRFEYTLKFFTCKFMLILVSFPWISVAFHCCCDWDKLWLLVILLKILLIMLFWYPFSFNTCFILAFSVYKSFLFLIIEYALLNDPITKIHT